MESEQGLLTNLLEEFFQGETQRENLLIDNYFVINEQGRLLHSHCTLCDAVTLGALVSAMLSAQKALISYCFPHTVKEKREEQFHRPINLGNSQEGLIVIPFYPGDFPLFLGHQYKEILNPGHVRFQLQSMAYSLEKFFKEKNLTKRAKDRDLVHASNTGIHVFPHLKEEEIDRLFEIKGSRCVDG